MNSWKHMDKLGMDAWDYWRWADRMRGQLIRAHRDGTEPPVWAHVYFGWSRWANPLNQHHDNYQTMCDRLLVVMLCLIVGGYTGSEVGWYPVVVGALVSLIARPLWDMAKSSWGFGRGLLVYAWKAGHKWLRGQ